MGQWVVTVKLPQTPGHDAKAKKKAGPCPINGKPCTDIAGESHTFLARLDGELTPEAVREVYDGIYQITRVEAV